MQMFAFLLALSQAANVGSMNLQQVDARLSETVYASRGGWLFHRLGHLICKNSARRDRSDKLWRRYAKLEREYTALGGVFVPDEEQEIRLETWHTGCEKGEKAAIATRWRKEVEVTESVLQEMEALLARKRDLKAGRSGDTVHN